MRLLYTGYFDRGNLGDNAMRDGNLAGFAELRPDWEFDLLPLPKFNKSFPSAFVAFLKRAKTCDGVVVNGGTYFHDEFGLRSVRILVTWLFLFLGIKATRRPLFMLGIGTGSVTTWWGKLLVGLVLRLPAFITARDDISAQLIGTARHEETPIVPDSAYLLNPPRDQASAKMISLALAPAPYFEYYRGDPEREAQAAEALASAIGAHLGAGAAITIFVFANTSATVSDWKTAGLLSDALEKFGFEVQTVNPTTPSQAIDALSSCMTLVAWRYHALLLGALAGTAVATIAYEPKCSRLRLELGLPNEAEIEPTALLSADHQRRALTLIEGASAIDPSRIAALVDRCRAGIAESVTMIESRC